MVFSKMTIEPYICINVPGHKVPNVYFQLRLRNIVVLNDTALKRIYRATFINYLPFTSFLQVMFITELRYRCG